MIIELSACIAAYAASACRKICFYRSSLIYTALNFRSRSSNACELFTKIFISKSHHQHCHGSCPTISHCITPPHSSVSSSRTWTARSFGSPLLPVSYRCKRLTKELRRLDRLMDGFHACVHVPKKNTHTRSIAPRTRWYRTPGQS